MVKETTKLWAGIGSLLVALGLLFPFLTLIGLILLVLALKEFADFYKDKNIFDMAILGFVFYLFGAAGSGILSFLFLLALFQKIRFISIFFMLCFFFISLFYLLGTIFFKISFDQLAHVTKEENFQAASLLLLIGGLFVILLVGFLLIFIAWIWLSITFFLVRAN